MKLTRQKIRQIILEAMHAASLASAPDIGEDLTDDLEYEQFLRGRDAGSHTPGSFPPAPEPPETADPEDAISRAYRRGYEAGKRAASMRRSRRR